MGNKQKLGGILVGAGLITTDQLDTALAEQTASRGSRLGMTLVRMGFLDEETLIRTLSNQLQLPVARIRGKKIGQEVLDRVPLELAEKYRCLPLFVKPRDGDQVLYLALEDPSDLAGAQELSEQLGLEISPVLVAPSELEDALQRHYHWDALAPDPALAPLACVPDSEPASNAPTPATETQLPGDTAPDLGDAFVDPDDADLDDPDERDIAESLDPDERDIAESLDPDERDIAESLDPDERDSDESLDPGDEDSAESLNLGGQDPDGSFDLDDPDSDARVDPADLAEEGSELSDLAPGLGADAQPALAPEEPAAFGSEEAGPEEAAFDSAPLLDLGDSEPDDALRGLDTPAPVFEAEPSSLSAPAAEFAAEPAGFDSLAGALRAERSGFGTPVPEFEAEPSGVGAPDPAIDDADDLELEPTFVTEDGRDAAPAPAAAAADAGGISAETILRALTQLLVEKRVITREEFVERLGQLAADTADGDI